MPRRPEIGNIQLYPNRPLTDEDKNGYTLKFFCPIRKKRVRKNCGTRDRREARRILRDCQERLLNATQWPEKTVRPRSSSMNRWIIGMWSLWHEAPHACMHCAIHRTTGFGFLVSSGLLLLWHDECENFFIRNDPGSISRTGMHQMCAGKLPDGR